MAFRWTVRARVVTLGHWAGGSMKGPEDVIKLRLCGASDYLGHPDSAWKSPGLCPVMLKEPYCARDQTWVRCI